MDVEYSVKKGLFAYTFCDFEMKLIAKRLKPELKKFDRKIERIENDPKNEGQVTFQVKIDELYTEKKLIQQIINDFSK